MTTAGWAIMIVSVGSIVALTVFCFWRLFTLPPSELEGNEQADIFTP